MLKLWLKCHSRVRINLRNIRATYYRSKVQVKVTLLIGSNWLSHCHRHHPMSNTTLPEMGISPRASNPYADGGRGPWIAWSLPLYLADLSSSDLEKLVMEPAAVRSRTLERHAVHCVEKLNKINFIIFVAWLVSVGVQSRCRLASAIARLFSC